MIMRIFKHKSNKRNRKSLKGCKIQRIIRAKIRISLIMKEKMVRKV